MTDATIVKSQLLANAGASRRTRPAPFLTDAEVAAFGLDDRALEAARRSTFRPGTRNGRPVPVRLTMELRITLQREHRARPAQ